MRSLYEPKDGYKEKGIHGRGTSRDEGACPRAEGGSAPRPALEAGGRGKRRAREDCRDAETGSRHGRAAPCRHQSQRASPLAENLVRDARVRQGRQCRLLLPKRAEVQNEVRDVRLQRQGKPRRRRHVADRLRAEGVDRRRRGKDRRAREESGELRTEPYRSLARCRAGMEWCQSTRPVWTHGKTCVCLTHVERGQTDTRFREGTIDAVPQ